MSQYPISLDIPLEALVQLNGNNFLFYNKSLGDLNVEKFTHKHPRSVYGVNDVWHAYPHSSRNLHDIGIARKLDWRLYKRLFRGIGLCVVERFYHILPTISTPSSACSRTQSPTHLALTPRGREGCPKMEIPVRSSNYPLETVASVDHLCTIVLLVKPPFSPRQVMPLVLKILEVSDRGQREG